jgi:hypothetical protein
MKWLAKNWFVPVILSPFVLLLGAVIYDGFAPPTTQIELTLNEEGKVTGPTGQVWPLKKQKNATPGVYCAQRSFLQQFRLKKGTCEFNK